MKMAIGTLYIVSTPIGNLQDITLRALDILKQVDCIAAEDTRHSQILLRHYGIHQTLLSYHEHNEAAQTEKIVQKLLAGHSIALISDAGTPLLSDPGFQLVKTCREQQIPIIPVPGASACIAALSVSGLPTDKFLFLGFLSAKKPMREKQIHAVKNVPYTLIFYESPHRIVELIDAFIHVCENDRVVVIARELTKTFETIYRGTLSAAKIWLVEDDNHQKGEFVVLLAGAEAPTRKNVLSDHDRRVLRILSRVLSPSQAVAVAAEITGKKKNQLYDAMLEKDDSDV